LDAAHACTIAIEFRQVKRASGVEYILDDFRIGSAR
jgi:hypothetical protein